MLKTFRCAAAGLFCICLAAPTFARTIYVKASAGGTATGADWVDAYPSLQTALASALRGDEIWVAAGTYRPAGVGGSRDATFVMKSDVAIYGGFPGLSGQEGDNSVRNPAANVTTLSGDLNGNDGPNFTNNGENSYHVVTGSGTDSTAILDGFTISGGNTTGFGAGLYRSGGRATVVNCTFTTNNAGSGAGVCSVAGGNLAITNCIFNGNRATYGGGLYTQSSGNATLTNCSFTGNSATYGGAMRVSTGGAAAVINCTFNGNTGSALDNYSGTLTVTNSILWGNTTAQIAGAVAVTYSCVQGGWAGQGNISADPRILLGAGDNLQLRRNSPCIDAGDSRVVPPTLTIARDLLGKPRLVEDPDTPNTGNVGSPPWPPVDMGACEYQPAAAERLYVKADAPADGDGTSWARACRYLQDALTAAQSRASVTEIWVAAGTYPPDRDAAHPGGTGSRAATFLLIPGVAVRGGFAGTENPATFDISQRNLLANQTILTGDLAGNDGQNFTNNSENSYHVVAAGDAVLDGCVISGGNANGSSPNNNGGGLYSSNPNLAVMNCVFTSNKAIYGGAMHISPGGTFTLINCALSGNSANSAGGVYTSGCNANLINCTLVRNVGAGLSAYGSGSKINVKNCILWANSSQISGTASITVTYSCIQDGYAGQGNISSDPRFMSLATGDLRLRRGAPCIDAGDSNAVPGSVTQDLSGGPRFADDPDTPDTGRYGTHVTELVDIGAYEYQPVGFERLYVDDNAAPGGTGASWATACSSLQDALAAARVRAGVTEIWVAAGMYTPDCDAAHPAGSRDRTATFQLLSGVAIYGGLRGNEEPAALLTDRDLRTNRSILSGDLAGDDGAAFANNGENSYHVVTGSLSGPSAVLDGFMLTGGNASISPNNYGAGMYNSSGSPTVANCIFIANSASSGGGGMYNSWSTASVRNCVFHANTTSNGGAIYNYHSNPVFTNCTITRNFATSGGGAMADYMTSEPVLTNCILWENSTPAIYSSGGLYLVIFSCVQGGLAGEDNISADPLFVDVGAGDVRLRAGSPCIDRGNNAALGLGIAKDLDGRLRFVDDPATADTPSSQDFGSPPIVDLGAYEFAPTALADLDHSGTMTAADFALFVKSFGHGGRDPAYNPEADFDRDGAVTLVDYQLWLQAYRAALQNPVVVPPLEYLGDFGRDGHVDDGDAAHLTNCFTAVGISPTDEGCANADLDTDQDIDMDDFGILQRCYTGAGGIDLTCRQ